MSTCLEVPIPDIPEIPSPFKFSAVIPAVSFQAEVCCQSVSFSTKALPIALPAETVTPAIVAIIRKANAAKQKWRDLLVIACQRQ